MGDIYLASFYSPDRYSWTHIYLDNIFLEMLYFVRVAMFSHFDYRDAILWTLHYHDSRMHCAREA